MKYTFILISFLVCGLSTNISADSLVSDVMFAQDSLILYNVLTPNGDGKNDVLAFDDLEQFDSVEIRVTDQWGQTVYSSDNYQNDWDGTKNGKAVPAGMYRYYLRLNGEVVSSNLSIIYN